MAQGIIISKPHVRWIGLVVALIILLGGVTIQTLAGFSHRDRSGHAWGSDDAWISYRYARNLAEGHGLVFNEGERVEGYSNLLYVLLMAVGSLFTDGLGIYAFSVVLNTIFTAAAMFVFHSYARRRFGDWVAGFGALLFAALPAVWLWTAAGLETPLALLLTISLWVSIEHLIEGDSRQHLTIAAVIAALSVLTRADGFITPLLAVLYLILKGHRRAAMVVGGVTVLTLAANIGFRMVYYGYPLPNTYYVKVSGSLFARVTAAMTQLLYYLPLYGLMPYLLIITVSLLTVLIDSSRNWRSVVKRLRFDVFLAVGWLGYFFYAGGDTFHERFLLVLMCLGFILLFEMAQSFRSMQDLILIAAPIFLLFHAAALIIDTRYDYRAEKYDRWVTLGEFLRDEYPDALIAVDGAGKVPYFSELQTIDMLGLNDAFISHQAADGIGDAGHHKHDADYVFSREPDVIASWLNPLSLDMTWDLTRDRYEQEGYELGYLVNSSAASLGDDNIINVTMLTDQEIRALTVNGYEYGVLVRVK